MGTWGTNAFEDDTALGIYDEYCSALTNFQQLETVFDTVLQKNYDMNDTGMLMDGFKDPLRVLVACELIAASLGKPTDKFPDASYHEDIGTTPLELGNLGLSVNDALRNKAKLSLKKIRDTKGIHLTELWMESDSYDEWKKEIDDLIQRLS